MNDGMWDNLRIGFDRMLTLIGQWLDAHFVNILAILIGAWVIRKFASQVISRILHRTVRTDLYPTKTDREKRIKTINSLVGAVLRVGVYIIVIILIIGEINPGYTTALFASAGLIGLALGFGAQNFIKDLVSGVFIITENQYRVGDVVNLGGVSGVVEDVTIRTTILRDLNGHIHHVPNGSITVTTNMTMGYSRINEDVIFVADNDIERIEKIINQVGQELASKPEFKHKILEPPHFLRFDGYAQNGMVVKILGKTSAGDQWEVKGALYSLLKKAFDKHGIEVANVPLAVVPPKKKRS